MIFSFSNKDFLDPKKVKAVYGVAGRGKSSVINNFLQSNNIPYTWTTSTNKLKRDAAERYGCEAMTVCSALFTSSGGRFYIDEKEPANRTIIIDEILQTSPKVLDWIRHHIGVYNIIIMTDTHQMLAIDNKRAGGTSFLKEFEAFLTEPFVLCDEGTETKRARDKETKEKIESLYSLNGDTFGQFNKDICSGRFPIIGYDDMPFSTNDIYITHLNETEDFLYRDKSFASASFNTDELIPKGGIASKPPKDYTRYPILSQSQAERLRSQSYYQLANVGSCTRHQGSECTTGQKLYYLVTPTSKVTNREWYTVVSRCWSLDSIVIVIVNRGKREECKQFRGKKVKNVKVLSIVKETNA